MSRHRVPGLDPTHDVWVGWDNPFQTYFAQVFALPSTQDGDDDDDIRLSLGDTPCAYLTVADLQDALRAYATIPEPVWGALLRDQRTALPPTPLQQRMVQWATEVPHA